MLVWRCGRTPRLFRYGDHFDVVVKENTHAAAYTSDALPLHTDLPYYTQPPGVQLLHSVTAVPPTNGGRSLLADGLAVAHELRQRNPSAYGSCYDTFLLVYAVAPRHAPRELLLLVFTCCRMPIAA